MRGQLRVNIGIDYPSVEKWEVREKKGVTTAQFAKIMEFVHLFSQYP